MTLIPSGAMLDRMRGLAQLDLIRMEPARERAYPRPWGYLGRDETATGNA